MNSTKKKSDERKFGRFPNVDMEKNKKIIISRIQKIQNKEVLNRVGKRRNKPGNNKESKEKLFRTLVTQKLILKDGIERYS